MCALDAAQRRVYLDYAASAPLSEAARNAELAYEREPFAGANPNSLHTPGRQAARALDQARRTLASCLGGHFRPADICFTSGGTESNNLALIGLAEGVRARDRRRQRVIISAIEHDSVLDLASVLRGRDFEVSVASANRAGVVEEETITKLLGHDVALVSVMAANNETGIVQPIDALARAAHAAGALMHTDAVQAFARVPLLLDNVDAVSVAAHKIGGPVGVGALALRGRVPLRPQSFGGGQEDGRRAGTQDVRGALAFAAAARYCVDHMQEHRAIVAAHAQALEDGLVAANLGIVPTVPEPMAGARLPGLVSLLVDGVDSETLVLSLDARGFAVSAGSACSSGSLDPSHVLTAMGIPRAQAFCSLRVSFDERVGETELQAFSQALVEVVRDRRHAR